MRSLQQVSETGRWTSFCSSSENLPGGDDSFCICEPLIGRKKSIADIRYNI